MTDEFHSFVDSSVGKCGAILRRSSPGRLLTRTVFRLGEQAPIYLVDVTLDYVGSARTWTRYSVRIAGSDAIEVGERARTGEVRLGGGVVAALHDAVPSYAEHLLVGELLSAGQRSLTYRIFDEGRPHRASDAALTIQGLESIGLADGSLVDAQRVRLRVGGRPTNTHWAIGGVVVMSDWCGARSYRVADVDQLACDLDEDVARHIWDFLDPGAATASA